MEQFRSEHDKRIIDATSIALRGKAGVPDDVDRLYQEIAGGPGVDKVKVACEIAVAFIRFAQDLKAAASQIQFHIETDDDEKCFNLYTYIEAVRMALYELVDSEEIPTGEWQFGDGSLEQIARYLWCCICFAEGEHPAGNTFRGMPILD